MAAQRVMDLRVGSRAAIWTQRGSRTDDPDACRVRITAGKGNKDCMVPSQPPSRAAVGLHIDTQRVKGAGFLFESSWQKPDSTRGCKLLTRYATAAGIAHPVSRHPSGTSC